MTDQEIAQYAYNAGFRGHDLAVAVAITHPESSGNPNARGSVTSSDPGGWGLWQITPGNSALLDPQANANAAFAKYRNRGFQPWTTYNNGAYSQYMPQATIAANNVMGSMTSTTSPPAPSNAFDATSTGNAITNAGTGVVGNLKVVAMHILNSVTLLAGFAIVAVGIGLIAVLYMRNTASGRALYGSLKKGVTTGIMVVAK
jgi:hypothetical protein